MMTTQTPVGTPPAAPIPAPVGLVASIDLTDKITLTWPALAGALSYAVWRGTALNGTGAVELASGLTATTYDDTTTDDEAVYYYFLKATHTAGTSGFSGVATGWRIAATPAVPTGVAATDALTSVITISWTAAARAVSYSVWRATTAGGTYTEIASGVTGTSYNDTTQIGVTRYYKVKAENYTGVSALSDYDSGYANVYVPPPPPPPDIPAGVSATDGDEGLVTISWSAASGADSYSVWRAATDDSGSATMLASGLTGTSYDDTTATPSTAYYYFVKATNAYGTSGFSTSDSGYLTAPPPPAEPDGVTATDGTAYGKVTVTWDAVAGATSYKVYRSDTVFGTKTLLASGLAGTSYDDTSLTDTATYYYWIKATNAGGDSGYGPAAAAEGGYAAVPADPGSVAATDGTEPLKVTVTWSAAAGAVSYSVYRSATYGGTKTLLAAGLTGTSYDDESLVDFGGYYYWVRAINAVGGSGYAGGDPGYAGYPATPAISAITTDQVEFVRINWGTVAGAATYGIWRATTDSFAAATQIATGLTGLEFDDDAAPFDTGLYYFVVSESAFGDGLPSPSAYGYSPGTLPGVPTIWFDGATGVDGHDLRWYATSLAVGYDVALGGTADPLDGYSSMEDVTTTLISGSLQFIWSPTGLAAQGYYPQYYWVRAKNRAGVSAWSAPVGPYTVA